MSRLDPRTGTRTRSTAPDDEAVQRTQRRLVETIKNGSFPAVVRQTRVARRQEQADVGDALDVSWRTVRLWERGVCEPNWRNRLSIAWWLADRPRRIPMYDPDQVGYATLDQYEGETAAGNGTVSDDD